MCKYCGFDFTVDSLYAEGAKCGYRNCSIFICCYDQWKKHMMDYHGVDVTSIKVEVEFEILDGLDIFIEYTYRINGNMYKGKIDLLWKRKRVGYDPFTIVSD